MTVIPIVSLKGGVGKSTIATNLAYKLSDNYRVLLIDIDPQNSISTLLCTDFKAGFSDVLVGDADILSVIKQPIKDNNNFFIIPAGKYALTNPLEYEQILTEHFLEVMLKRLKNEFDVIVFDTPPRISKHLESVLHISTFFITVITPDPASYASFRIFIEFLRTNNFFEKFYLVVNEIDSSEISEDFNTILKAIVKNKMLGIIPKDKAVLEAQGNCMPVVSYRPESPFAVYMDKIVFKLKKLINKQG